MSFQVAFTVEGKPRGKGRPRFARRGNFVSTYTDAKTMSYETEIKLAATSAMGSSKPLESPVKVYLTVKVPVPTSYSKKRTMACLAGLERPTKKPDIDNIAKIYLDAMNKVVYLDDTQVVHLVVSKIYGTEPFVAVHILEEV